MGVDFKDYQTQENYMKVSAIVTMSTMVAVAFSSTAVLAQYGSDGAGQGKISTISVSPAQPKAGEEVKITIAADGTASNCGMYVNFGDGTDANVKITSGGDKFPVTLTHKYAQAGSYTVKAEGKKVTTHFGCVGKASTGVTVAAAPVAAAAPAATAAKSATATSAAATVPACPEGYKLKGKVGKAKDFTCSAGKDAKKPEKVLNCADGLEYFQTKTTLGCRKTKK
jgi:hypothetical protein